jgi:O-antigen ligase
MARDYPVFGAGAGSWYTAFPRYRGEDIDGYYVHAENDYAQFLVETGALGVAIVGLLPLMALACAVLALARRRDPLARGFAFAVLMGVVAIGIHSTVDFNLQIPANALVFSVLLAYGWIALYLDRAAGTGKVESGSPTHRYPRHRAILAAWARSRRSNAKSGTSLPRK